jgi:hypothetical protein
MLRVANKPVVLSVIMLSVIMPNVFALEGAPVGGNLRV